MDLSENQAAHELCEQVQLLTAEAREGLLQQALTVSNEKCNDLILRQNALVEELTRQVRNVRWSVNALGGNLKENNESLLKRLRLQAESMLNELKEKIRELKNLSIQIQAEVSTATAKATDEATKALKERVNQAADDAVFKMDEQAKSLTQKVKEAEKEIDRAREDIRFERGFRKFFFWATPVLLLAQSILTVIMLLI